MKILCVICNCFCLSCFIFNIALAVALTVYFVYDSKEAETNAVKLETIKDFAASSLMKELDYSEMLGQSMESYIAETTTTITSDAFTKYVTDSGLLDLDSFNGANWIVEVPETEITYWHDIYIPSLGLSSEDEESLNSELDSSIEIHYVVCLLVPFQSSLFGNDFSLDETYNNLISESLEMNEPRYSIEYTYGSFEYFFPIKLTNFSMNNSRVVNSVLRTRFKIETIARSAFELFEKDALFAVYHDDICLVSTCGKPSSAESQTDSFDTEGDFGVDWGVSITVGVAPTEEFYDFEMRMSKIFGLICPLIGAIIISLFLAPICCQCMTYINRRSKELKLVQKVSSALNVMNFESKAIRKLEKKRRTSKLEKSMKQMVKNLKMYRTYLPQTLLSKIEESSKETNIVSCAEDEHVRELLDLDELSKVVDDDFDSSSVHSGSTENSTSTSNSLRSGNSSRVGGRKRRHSFSNKSGIIGDISKKQGNHRNCVVMVVTIVGIEEVYELFSSHNMLSDFQEGYEKWLTSIIECVSRFGGDFLSFSFGSVIFSWNAVRIQMEITKKSVMAAFELISQRHFTGKDVRLRIAITKGMAFAGHFSVCKGTLRQFDIMGYPLSFAHEMTQQSTFFNKNYDDNTTTAMTATEGGSEEDGDDDGDDYNNSSHSSTPPNCESLVFCDQYVNEAIKYVSETVCIDVVRYREQFIKVYRILKFLSLKENSEWMYQCKEGFDTGESESRDVYSTVDSAWELFRTGNLSEAKYKMNTVVEHDELFGMMMLRRLKMRRVLSGGDLSSQQKRAAVQGPNDEDDDPPKK